MEMINWLLKNRVVQVAWGLGILAVLLAWMFGGSKAGHDTADVSSQAKTVQLAEVSTSTKDADITAVAEVKQEAEAVVEAKAVVVDVKQEAEAVIAETKTAVAAGAVAVVATAAATVQAVADTGEAVVETAKEVVVPTETAVEEVVTTEVVVTEAPVEVDVKAEEVAETDASVTAESTALAGSLAEKSSEDLLKMAREAYWNNGLDEAAELYTALIEREPTVIEHKGELGNVFWRQGFPKKAAELYADIAEPMIEKGNGERVSNMVGFIGLFFPERAGNIRKLLEK